MCAHSICFPTSIHFKNNKSYVSKFYKYTRKKQIITLTGNYIITSVVLTYPSQDEPISDHHSILTETFVIRSLAVP